MNIFVTFTCGRVFEDRARDMHNAEPRFHEYTRMRNVAKVEIIHQQQSLLKWEA